MIERLAQLVGYPGNLAGFQLLSKLEKQRSGNTDREITNE
jgi:hypothetical protein